MNPAGENVLEMLHRCHDKMGIVLNQSNESTGRAAMFAAMLREPHPNLPLYACSLRMEEDISVSALDQAGRQRPDWEEKLVIVLKKQGEKERATIRAPELTEELNASSHDLMINRLQYEDHHYGHLMIAFPRSSASSIDEHDRFWLMNFSRVLALRLTLEQYENERRTLVKDLLIQSGLATASDLASPIAHEFNNYLNMVLLHLAVLEQGMPAEKRHDLGEMRRQTRGIAELIKRFQQLRRRNAGNYYSVDVNRVIQETLEQIASVETRSTNGSLTYSLPNEASVVLSLTPQRPILLGSGSDLQRLCTMLITNAVAAGSDRIAVSTEIAAGAIRLIVEDTGPSVASDALNNLFDPAFAGREGTNSLELAACKSLTGRLQGTISAINVNKTGVRITVEFPSV